MSPSRAVNTLPLLFFTIASTAFSAGAFQAVRGSAGAVPPRIYSPGSTGAVAGADDHTSRERSKVLLLVHPETTPVRDLIESLIAGYKRRFQQEPALWETTEVCAAF